MTLYCWSMKREVTLFWKWSWKRSSGDVITSMESLTEDTVVLGTRTGLIAILDWKNVKRASFSYTVSPTLVDSWESYMNDQQISTPPARGMGIRKLTVAKEIFPGELVRYKLVWLTTCGWVLSSMVEYSPRRNDSTSSRIRRMKRCFEVLFETDPITWKSATGDVVSDDVMKSWVMPTEPIPSFASESVLIWNKFNDDVTRILPHHDQRVLAPLASTINEARGQPKIQWMSIGKPTCNTVRAKQVETRSIRLSTRAGLPTHLAVHPSHEWIVISTAENGMYLVHSTSKLR